MKYVPPGSPLVSFCSRLRLVFLPAFCSLLSYYPSVFILKPGQIVHINKGRLHAFRKLAPTDVPVTDCHASLRGSYLASKEDSQKEEVCISVAWDWMYRGITSEGVNREVVHTLECASLNRRKKVLSLAIPELALLQMARTLTPARGEGASDPSSRHPFLAFDLHDSNSWRFRPSNDEILRGILPSLRYLVSQHVSATERARRAVTTRIQNTPRVSISQRPNSWEDPQVFALDPYGNSDFFCKLCSKELSNVYMHCDGCEKILNKDFNICVDCHADGRYKVQIRMHPSNDTKHSTINHTGSNTSGRQSRCPCKRGPVCRNCSYCSGCSCKCHQWFTLHHRFFSAEDEEALVGRVEAVVGDRLLPHPEEVALRLGTLQSSSNELSEGVARDSTPENKEGDGPATSAGRESAKKKSGRGTKTSKRMDDAVINAEAMKRRKLDPDDTKTFEKSLTLGLCARRGRRSLETTPVAAQAKEGATAVPVIGSANDIGRTNVEETVGLLDNLEKVGTAPTAPETDGCTIGDEAAPTVPAGQVHEADMVMDQSVMSRKSSTPEHAEPARPMLREDILDAAHVGLAGPPSGEDIQDAAHTLTRWKYDVVEDKSGGPVSGFVGVATQQVVGDDAVMKAEKERRLPLACNTTTTVKNGGTSHQRDSGRETSLVALVRVDAVRIAIDDKVFSSNCKLIFCPDAGRCTLTLSDNAELGVRQMNHTINLKEELQEMKYYVAINGKAAAQGETVTLDFDKSEYMSFLSMKLVPNEDNPDSAVKGHYILIEFRRNKELNEFLNQMKRDKVLGAFVTESSKLQTEDVEVYGKTLLHAARKENSSKDVLFEYPFPLDEKQIENATNTLNEAALKPAAGASVRVRQGDGKLALMACDDEKWEGTNVEAAPANNNDSGSKKKFALIITKAECNTLEPGRFLGDTLIDFWMQWYVAECVFCGLCFASFSHFLFHLPE